MPARSGTVPAWGSGSSGQGAEGGGGVGVGLGGSGGGGGEVVGGVCQVRGQGVEAVAQGGVRGQHRGVEAAGQRAGRADSGRQGGGGGSPVGKGFGVVGQGGGGGPQCGRVEGGHSRPRR